MQPMTIAEPPLIAILRGQRSTGDGLHLVARSYRKGLRRDPQARFRGDQPAEPAIHPRADEGLAAPET